MRVRSQEEDVPRRRRRRGGASTGFCGGRGGAPWRDLVERVQNNPGFFLIIVILFIYLFNFFL